MSSRTFLLAACAASVALSASGTAIAAEPKSRSHHTTPTAGMSGEQTTTVGGAAMSPSRTIVANAVNSADHTTLVAAVQAAGLVDTLNSAGPFTVFAPTNAAFNRLPAGTVESLVQPANRDTLVKILTYHVVAGRVSGSDLMAAINAGHGRATLTTVQGQPLIATMSAGGITLTDARGGMSRVTIADVQQSNGVIHVVDSVLLP